LRRNEAHQQPRLTPGFGAADKPYLVGDGRNESHKHVAAIPSIVRRHRIWAFMPVAPKQLAFSNVNDGQICVDASDADALKLNRSNSSLLCPFLSQGAS
jgi:hypothetical protein